MSHSMKVEFKPLNGDPSDQSDEDEVDIDDDDLGGHSRAVYKKFHLVQETNTDETPISAKLLLKIYLLALVAAIIFLANWNYPYKYQKDSKTKANTLQAAARLSAYPSLILSSTTLSTVTNNSDNLKTISNKTSRKPSARTSMPFIINNIPPNSYTSTNPRIDSYNNSNDLYVNKNHNHIVASIQTHETYMDSVLQETNTIDRPDLLDDLRVYQNVRYNIAKWWTINHRDDNRYVTITNYIRAIKSFDHNSSVTFTTQASPNFLHHTVELCKRWDGPISVAVFGTGRNLNNSITIIKYMRDCLPIPLRMCIRDKVSWHIVYESKEGPKPETLGYPRQHLNYGSFKSFVKHDECPKMASHTSKLMVREFSERLENSSLPEPRHLYPINVLRNTARLASTTRYLMACDIELYPSMNLVPMFSNYMSRHDPSIEYSVKKYIFALPIFELKADVVPPQTKRALAEEFERGNAIFFHKFVCDYCQDFPKRVEWIKSLDRIDEDELSIFVKTQRDKSRSSWEPIFIGTNDDPLYDDRLTWDGRRDKMGQMYEMCLKDYYILIASNAFLVHSPGIKHIDKADVMNRVQYMMSNNQIYETTMTRLKKTYANYDTINKC